MARSSSFGSRRTSAWVVDQRPRPLPRVVRLGRAANDNGRAPGANAKALIVVVTTTIAMLALYGWRLL